MKEKFQTHVFNVNQKNSRAFPVFPNFGLVLYCELNIDFVAFFLTSFLLKLVRVRVVLSSRVQLNISLVRCAQSIS